MSNLAKARGKLLDTVQSIVLKRHFNAGGIDYGRWIEEAEALRPSLIAASAAEFEAGMQALVGNLRSSHTVFYHDQPSSFPPQHTLNATLQRVDVAGTGWWMFLDVFEDGPASVAGVRPGDLIAELDGIAPSLADSPRFGVGREHRMVLMNSGTSECREVTIRVPSVKATTNRPPIVEPTSFTHARSGTDTGVLRVRYFPGALGLRFAGRLDAAMRALNESGCRKLIVDLRGNIGGSLGFARLASYLSSGQTPIGHSLTPTRLRTGYTVSELPQVRMPATRTEAALTLARFAVRDKSVMLTAQGLGLQPFHGKIAVIINEWTNSAGEIVAAFCQEAELATVIGEPSRGNVLGAANFKVGLGYWLRIPVFGWYTARGRALEGCGVKPDLACRAEPAALAAGLDNQMELARSLLAAR